MIKGGNISIYLTGASYDKLEALASKSNRSKSSFIATLIDIANEVENETDNNLKQDLHEQIKKSIKRYRPRS